MQNESGSALLASVLVIALITGAGLSAMTTTSVNQNKSQNVLTSKQAFYLAEAGMSHGKLYLYQQYLANPNVWTTYATTQPQTLIASTPFAGLGSYTVTIRNASGPALFMQATGTAANNASTTISSVVTIGYANLQKAFVAGRNILISGNAILDGNLPDGTRTGGVHANNNLTITGSPQIHATATAVNTYSEPGPGVPVVDLFKGGGQPKAAINTVRLIDYDGARDYLLTAIYDSQNNLIPAVKDNSGTNQPMVNGTWNCWTAHPVYTYNRRTGNYMVTSYWWEVTCGSPLNATYYASGDVVISASVATDPTNPWITSIITTGSITVQSAILNIRPPSATDGALFKKQTENVLFVAYRDILIQGTSDQHFRGIIRAREQIGITGAPSIYGYIVAQDGSTASTLVSSNFISGALHLTYNGDMANGIQGTVVSQSTLY